MDYEDGKNIIKVEGDRISSLPDNLIHKILSYIGIEQAVETSVLSSRWRYIWTSIDSLNFSSDDCYTEFITHVLHGRNNQMQVSSVQLTFSRIVSDEYVKRILEYAFSHNVQQLNITYLHEWTTEIPRSLFRSQSLKHLTLVGNGDNYSIIIPTTLEVPTLTTLTLQDISMYDDNTNKCVSIFSNIANLKSLTLKHCTMMRWNDFNIRHPGLVNLTLEDGFRCVNVVTPQLKNLIIKYWRGIHLVSAPNLYSLRYKDTHGPLKLSTDLLNLEKVDICISYPFRENANAHKVFCLLQQLHSVKFLTLNMEIIKLISSSVKLISHQPSPFVNLKSLKIYPVYVDQPEVIISTEVKNYLLDGSPGAAFTMVSHEEIRAERNVTSTRKLMRDLQVILDQLKENSERDMKMEGHFGEKMTHVEQLEKGYKDICPTISLLRAIEGVLEKLPASHRDKLQAQFSRLCAEVGTIMDNTMDHSKNQCDRKLGSQGSNVYFHELATTSQPPS